MTTTLQDREARGGVRDLTLRDYFAAHAPAEPQPWFAPTVPERPKLPSSWITAYATEPLLDAEAAQRRVDLWRVDPCYDLDERLGDDPATQAAREAFVAFAAAWETYWKAKADWERLRDRERFLQWPWAWADAVLGCRHDAA